MTTQTKSAVAANGREISISRTINAPRELVFDAWTDVKHLAKWWGPDGFTTTTSEINIAPGGKWIFIMHGPDGTDYPNMIIFSEIKRPELISYIHSSGKENDPGEFATTVTFADKDSKTEITLKSLFKTAEACRLVIEKYGAIEGGKQHLTHLDEYVIKQINKKS